MPESPRKRSTPAAKAEPEVVPAEPAKTAQAAKKAAKAAAPVEPAEAPAPAKKATKSAGKAAKKAAAEPVQEPVPVPAQEPTGDESGTDEPEFLNRAARRAKGRKGSGALPVSGRGQANHGRGAVPGQRQWGARRSGG